MNFKQLAQTIATAATLLIAQPIQAETFYFHNDHLGTPQALTDKDGEVVWQGNYSPFGGVNETTATVEQNIRFPGQYFEEETGLHYNYFRDYDPGTGRYIESDPIGLGGGVNTFGYVGGNPNMTSDFYGLRGSYCFRPLNDYSGQNGSGPILLNHQFICVTQPNGTMKCDSTNNPAGDKNPFWQNPFSPTPGASSLPSQDNEGNSQCFTIDDDKDRCFEDCVLSRWQKPRPGYALGPLGTDCQEYSWEIFQSCKAQCP